MRVGVLGRALAILQAKEAMIASEDDKCLFLGVLSIQRHCTVYMFDDFVRTVKLYRVHYIPQNMCRVQNDEA